MTISKNIKLAWLKWKSRYRFQIVEEETYEVKFIFVLNRLNVLAAISVITIILMLASYLLIAFTPLKQYIPGYGDIDIKRELIKLRTQTDKLEENLRANDKYNKNLKAILLDNPPIGDTLKHTRVTNKEEALKALEKKNKKETEFRENVEQRDRFVVTESIAPESENMTIAKDFFFTPLKGSISHKPGAPLVITAGQGKPVMAAQDGHIISAGIELGKGNTLTIQHPNDYITIYRGLENISFKVGKFVNTGEVLAFTGLSGRLEFELWYKGQPLDPAIYINFE